MRILSHSRFRAGTAAAAGAVLLTGTLAACGSDGPSGSSETLEVWVYQDGSTRIQAEFAERFNETSDIKVKLTEIPGENYQERMRTAMGTPNAPDIFFNWGGGSISDFVEQDMLVDLTGILDSDPDFKDAFIPSILDSGAVNNSHYGIPMRGVQPVILFYNTELFDQIGAGPPETWDDMLAAVDAFLDEGVTPIALGASDSWTSMMWLEYLLDREGGPMLWQRIQGGESEAWGDPAVVAMAETTHELIDTGAFGPNFLSTDYVNDGASTFFAQGRAAMHLMGSWEYANQLENQPEFAENSLGYATFPVIEDGSGDAGGVVGNPTNYWSVNSNVQDERLDAAVEFMKLAGSEEYARALVENGDVPATTGVEELLDDHVNPEYARWQYDVVSDASSFTLSWDQALP
ncbi:ABC transporter substrate-binding protein, partial [Streptomyces otsuchiensis]|uniref:ABC transporter substrate-binding protein n=1 Tax=Streptomyces otsuchiensis TaxID=2681388 RepID=UPI00103237F6